MYGPPYAPPPATPGGARPYGYGGYGGYSGDRGGGYGGAGGAPRDLNTMRLHEERFDNLPRAYLCAARVVAARAARAPQAVRLTHARHRSRNPPSAWTCCLLPQLSRRTFIESILT